jgi:hypothetical protein
MRSPTGRYQSRLLNFLNQQGQKLKDQAGQSLRRWKVSVVWGAEWSAQILLYPIQALFQATQQANRQLRATVSRAIGFLMPGNKAIVQAVVPSDLAIQEVLSPESAAIQAIIASGVMITSGLRVQGIASDRTTQALCLITTDNQPLSIGAEQQQLLHDHIATALAYYWELWQQYQAWQQDIKERPRRSGRFLKFVWAALPPGLAALMSHSGLTISGLTISGMTIADRLAPAEFSNPHLSAIASPAALNPATDRPNTSVTWANIFSPTTTWINTPAETVGYVRHPLEILLGWLDQVLVWLEQGFTWVGNLLKKD